MEAEIVRDIARECCWLATAELDAGALGFARGVGRRLAVGEELYGDRWAVLGIPKLIDELSEEALDLGAWGVLALQALEQQELAENHRERVATRLRATILWGAYAHSELGRASSELQAVLTPRGMDR